MNEGCKYCKWFPRFSLWSPNMRKCKKRKKGKFYDGHGDINISNLEYCEIINRTQTCEGFEKRSKK